MILVTYHSNTGNTKRVAGAIYEALPESGEILPADEVKDVASYDVVFAGFPMEAYGPGDEAQAFLKALPEGTPLALFVTHGAPEAFPLMEEWLDRFRKAAAHANLLGLFHCQGQMADAVAEQLARSGDPQLERFAAMAPATKGKPDDDALGRANAFAREMVQTL